MYPLLIQVVQIQEISKCPTMLLESAEDTFFNWLCIISTVAV